MGKEQELVQSIRTNDVESFKKVIAKFKSKSSKFEILNYCGCVCIDVFSQSFRQMTMVL